jgi:two-component system, OmpR family, sensor histidine kinase KdpD
MHRFANIGRPATPFRIERPVNSRASGPLLLMPYLWSTVAVAAAVMVGQLLALLTPLPNLAMIFLMAVLFAAVRFGMWPAIYASCISFLAYNFFFIPPLYTLTITEPYEFLALIIFLTVAVITSALAGRVRDQARIAAGRMRATRRLYALARKLSELATVEALADGAAGEIHTSLGRPALILLDQDGALSLVAAWPPEDTVDAQTMEAAMRVFTRGEASSAGLDASTPPWFFVPLRTQRGSLGVIGIAQDGGVPLDSETRTLLDTLSEQIAAALERASLAREMVSARAAAETERVRNTLLASISHDFRTPLASILGSATSLLEYRDKLDAAAQTDLLVQIKHEAEHLDEMVRNLLAITRIDAGALELRYDWVDLREVIDRVVGAARRRGVPHDLEIGISVALPMVRADATLVEQALTNVVSNALLHTPPKTRVTLDAIVETDAIRLRVTDEGPGIAADLLPRAFEKFVRARKHEVARADGGEGTGLGLAIAKGILEAHRGSIVAESPVVGGHGTRIVLTFPREETPRDR